MKLMKKSLLFCIVLLISTLFTGCKLIINADIQYDEKGKGALSLITGMDEELWKAAQENGGAVDLSEFEKIKIDGETYYGKRVKTEFEDFDDLNSKMTSAPMGETYALFTEFKADKHGLVARPNPAYFGQDEFGQLKGMGVVIAMPLTITTSGKITESNGTIADNKHMVSWDMTSLPAEITLQTKTDIGRIFLIIGIVIAVIAVIVGAVFLVLHLINNKKPAKKKSAYRDEDPFADF